MSLGSLAAAKGADSQDASLTLENLAELVGEGAADTNDDEYELTTPLFNFIINGAIEQGESVAVVIPLATGKSLPKNAVYRKYNTTNGWFNFVEDSNNSVSSAHTDDNGNCPAANDASYTSGLSESDNCIQLIIEDGGPNDADLMMNGSIEDPGAIAISVQIKNSAPVIVINPHEANINEETNLTLIAQATDADGDDLSFSWQQVSGPTVNFNDTTSSEVFITLPKVDTNQVVGVEVTVSDGILSSTTATSFTINPEIEIIIVVPEPEPEPKTESSGGSMGTLLLLAVIFRLRKSTKIYIAA
jgi:hypothetical protein